MCSQTWRHRNKHLQEVDFYRSQELFLPRPWKRPRKPNPYKKDFAFQAYSCMWLVSRLCKKFFDCGAERGDKMAADLSGRNNLWISENYMHYYNRSGISSR